MFRVIILLSKAVLRDTRLRRNVMLWVMGAAVVMLFLGSWLLSNEWAHRHWLLYFLYWAFCGWLTITGVSAERGVLHFEAPPTMLGAIVASVALAVGIGLSPLGKRMALGLPLAALVGYQGFRIAVELLMHRAYKEGLMPVQMSYSGRNFDIVTGITAVLLGAWLATGRRSRPLVVAWNVLGLALLANILVVALLSAPTPLRVFMNEPSNVWITHAPWVWLPTVMVLAAMLGHVLVFRRLADNSS